MVSQCDLKALGITELKKIGKALGIKGVSKFRSCDKDELVQQIYNIQKGGKPRESRSCERTGSPKKASKSRSRSREKKKQDKAELTCGMENKKCMASKYKKDDILILAKKCGISTKNGNKDKSRAQLCEEISSLIQRRDEQNVVDDDISFEEKPQPQQQSNKLCPGGVVSGNLANKTVVEIKDLLKQSNIISGIPKKKADLTSYLCAVENNKRCDPKNNVSCDSGYTCDTSNTPGICISDKFAGDRISAGDNIEEFIFNGRKIIGTKKAINDLKNYGSQIGPVPQQGEKKKRPPMAGKGPQIQPVGISRAPIDIRDELPEQAEKKRVPQGPPMEFKAPRDQPIEIIESNQPDRRIRGPPPPSSPRAPSPPPPPAPPMRPRAPPPDSVPPPILLENAEDDVSDADSENWADEEKIEDSKEYKDIEAILEAIRNDSGEKLEDLTNIQKKVLECLGLIG